MDEIEPQSPAELFDLSGQVAMVTGASSGLGDRFARVLHRAGATVVVLARRADRLDALRAAHESIVPLAVDVTDDAALRAAVDQTVERFGRIDVVVNNAGGGVSGPALEESLDNFHATLELNLVSVFNLARLAAVPMIEAGRGSIINIASVYGLVSSWPIPNTGYTAAKGAVVQLTRELGCQWAKHGVRVNAIAPGLFPSEATESMTTVEWGQNYVRRKVPMGRFGRPDELDGALLFLASDAASFVTGQTVSVDGGWAAS